MKMDYEHARRAANNMQKFGGSFMATIGEAWFQADPINKRRLENAFRHEFGRYSSGEFSARKEVSNA